MGKGREREREWGGREREKKKKRANLYRHHPLSDAHLFFSLEKKKKNSKNNSVPVRAEMRSYFLSYLCTHAPTLQPFVAASLCQLLSRLVKLGWYDDEGFRALPDEARAALDAARARGDRAGYALMLRLLGALVAEFNAPSPGRTLTQHR